MLIADKRDACSSILCGSTPLPTSSKASPAFRRLKLPLAMESNGSAETLRREVHYLSIEAHLDRSGQRRHDPRCKTDPRICLAVLRSECDPRHVLRVIGQAERHRRHLDTSYQLLGRSRGEPIEELGVPITHHGTTLLNATRFVEGAMA